MTKDEALRIALKATGVGINQTMFYQGKVIGHIETDSDGDPLGIVYDPKSVLSWEIYGFNDIDQLAKEMLNQYSLRVLQGTERK